MFQKIAVFLNVSRNELRGYFVFLFLIAAFTVAPYIYEKHFITYQSIKVEELKGPLAEIENNSQYEKPDFSLVDESLKPDLFYFNPNNLPLTEWIRLGLTEKQARTIRNYESKGGRFYKKEDLRKIYSISESQYLMLEPYINIPEKKYSSYASGVSTKLKKAKSAYITVELNQADSISLLDIKGVGPAFASRIIKYRNRLGGFADLEQLKEVWGIDSVKFNQIKKQVKIDRAAIHKININSGKYEDIKKIPYINYKQKNAIIAYRNQHGDYKVMADLKKIVLMDEPSLRKIEPYIKFND